MATDSAAPNTAFLAGRGILVTRPAGQADALCARIEAAGGRALRLPVLAIESVEDSSRVQAGLAELGLYDLAIFISANALHFCLKALSPAGWPAQLPIAVVGRATARAVDDSGLRVALCPRADFSSEGLLALPELQRIQGKRILILRGQGGREHLREQLEARGAQVSYLEVYRRVRPDTDPQALLACWRAGEIDAVLVASNESLQNLQAMIGTLGQDLLRTSTLIVASARTEQCARELGLQGKIQIAQDATDVAMLAALHAHFSASAQG